MELQNFTNSRLSYFCTIPKLSEKTRNCKVVPVSGDGNCGFYAISAILKLTDCQELSREINREQFINKVI